MNRSLQLCKLGSLFLIAKFAKFKFINGSNGSHKNNTQNILHLKFAYCQLIAAVAYGREWMKGRNPEND